MVIFRCLPTLWLLPFSLPPAPPPFRAAHGRAALRPPVLFRDLQVGILQLLFRLSRRWVFLAPPGWNHPPPRRTEDLCSLALVVVVRTRERPAPTARGGVFSVLGWAIWRRCAVRSIPLLAVYPLVVWAAVGDPLVMLWMRQGTSVLAGQWFGAVHHE